MLSNHDVTRHATRYGRLDSTGGGVGDEARVGPDTPLDPALGLRRARAATLLMLALPGSAYVYQGEELGLPEVVDLPEDVLADPIWERSGHTRRGRDGCRVPIPWTSDGPSLGFGSGDALAAAAGGLGRAVRGGAAGRPGLDARALPRGAGAAPGAAVAQTVDWLPSPEGSLSFRRLAADGSSVVCVVACTDAAVPLPAYDEVLVASADLERGPDGAALLPGDAAVWLQVR